MDGATRATRNENPVILCTGWHRGISRARGRPPATFTDVHSGPSAHGAQLALRQKTAAKGPVSVQKPDTMPPTRHHLQPLSAPPGGVPARGTRGALAGLVPDFMLDKCPQNRGVGLDFVRKREYGRSRWLEYPG